MDILGIGPLEFLLIILIALIVLGPNDMLKAARSVGSFLRKVVTSPAWRTFMQAQRDMRNLPNALMREAGLEDAQKILPEIKAQVGLGAIQQDLNRISGDLKTIGQDIQQQATAAPRPVNPTTPPRPEGEASNSNSASEQSAHPNP